MENSSQAHRLVIQNLDVLESAPEIAEKVQKDLFAAIDKKIKFWVEEHGGWVGVYDYLNTETTFRDSDWPENDEEEFLVYYTVRTETDGDDYIYPMSSLLGVKPDPYGIWWEVDERWITCLSNNGKAKGVQCI